MWTCSRSPHGRFVLHARATHDDAGFVGIALIHLYFRSKVRFRRGRFQGLGYDVCDGGAAQARLPPANLRRIARCDCHHRAHVAVDQVRSCSRSSDDLPERIALPDSRGCRPWPAIHDLAATARPAGGGKHFEAIDPKVFETPARSTPEGVSQVETVGTGDGATLLERHDFAPRTRFVRYSRLVWPFANREISMNPDFIP